MAYDDKTARRTKRPRPRDEKVEVEIEVEVVRSGTPPSPEQLAAGERFVAALAARLLGRR